MKSSYFIKRPKSETCLITFAVRIGRSLIVFSNANNSLRFATKAVEKMNFPPSGKIFLITTSISSPSTNKSNRSSSSLMSAVSFLNK